MDRGTYQVISFLIYAFVSVILIGGYLFLEDGMSFDVYIGTRHITLSIMYVFVLSFSATSIFLIFLRLFFLRWYFHTVEDYVIDFIAVACAVVVLVLVSRWDLHLVFVAAHGAIVGLWVYWFISLF